MAIFEEFLQPAGGNIPVFQHMEGQRCCGCEACVDTCPVGIISMQPDWFGFRYPQMDAGKCIHCQKCVKVCPALSGPLPPAERRDCYAGYVRDENIVLSSSSGGFFSAIATAFAEQPQSYIAAVVWAEDFRSTRHFCGTIADLEDMKRSKYIQSRKNHVYQAIRQRLTEGGRVLFVGCPCEVWGLKNYLGAEHPELYCVDFVCQGPTSEKVMADFAEHMEARFHAPISSLNLRHVGSDVWIPQWMDMRFENGKRYLKVYRKTALGTAFCMMQRPSCYICPFVDGHRRADLTLGDFHGPDESATYYNPKGTSILVVNSAKGQQLLDSLSGVPVQIVPVSYDSIARRNPRIRTTWEPYPGSQKFWADYQRLGLFPAARKAFTMKQWLQFTLPHSVKKRLSRVKARLMGRQ